MALTITNAGANGNETAATLTITGVTAAVDDMLVVLIAASNSGTSGASCITDVTTTGGNSFIPRSIVNRDPGGSDDGTTLGMFTCLVTAALSSATLTINYSPNCLMSAAICYRVQPAAGSFVEFRSVAAGTSGALSTYQWTSSAVSVGDTVIMAAAIETDDTITPDSDTTGGSWSTIYTRLLDSGLDASCQTITSQHKTLTNTTAPVWDISTGGGNRDYAINSLIIRETVSSVDSTANSITTGATTADSPAATITVSAVADAISSTAVADSPSAVITVSTVSDGIESTASAGTPAATVTTASTASDIVSAAAVAGSPSAEISGPGIYHAGQATSTTSNTTLAISPVTAEVGDMLVIYVASDNSGAGGTNALSGFADTSGNVYDNYLNSVSSSGGAENDGVVLTVCQVPITVAMVADTITISYSTATVHKTAVAYRAVADEGNELHCVFGGTAAGSSSTQTRTATINEGRTVFGVVALESDDAVTLDSDTTNGTWSSNYGGISDTGADEDAIQLVTQFKTVTATGSQTYNTSTSAARDYAMRLVTVYEALATVDTTANDVTTGQPIVDSPSATITVSTASDAISSTATAGEPSASIAVATVADAIDSTAIAGQPAAVITVNTTGNDITSGAPVAGSPDAEIVTEVDSTANSITCGTPIVGESSAVIVVATVADAITTDTPTAGEPSALVTVATVADPITSTAEVDSAAATITISFEADDITTGNPIAGEPSATISADTTVSEVTSTAVAGQPEATITLSTTADDIETGSPVLDSPAATIVCETTADEISSTATAGQPAATITCSFNANGILCGVPFFTYAQLVTLCVDAHDLYQSGTRRAMTYQPGARKANVYQHGSDRTAIYQPGAASDVYAPGTAATQVGCHE